MNITILGAGAWGTALAISLANKHSVTLWARDADQVDNMKRSRSNERYLPDIDLPGNLALSADHADAIDSSELVIVAVPIVALRSTLEQLALSEKSFGVIWVCKGFEAGTSKLPHQVVAEVLPERFPRGVLSGPSFAQEVARSLPTALTLASSDEEFTRNTAQSLHHSRLRIYPSTDVIGVEVGGAVKNVMAIASGICDGLGLGHNARAALLTRGLAEITRLGLQLGGRSETLVGLSGLGDLILTCTGDLSRNRRVGLMLAKNQKLTEILSQLGHVAEGVSTAREVHQFAEKVNVSMPICDAVFRILHEDMPVAEMVAELLNRAPNMEIS